MGHLRTFTLLLLLAVAACSSPIEKANREAAQAEQLFRAGNLPAAREAIARALSHRDDQIDILLLDAAIKFRMQDYGAAYDAYRVALAIDPNNMTALVGVSQLGLATGNRREARSAIARALAIDPRQPEVLLSKGVLALERNDYGEAIAIGQQLSEVLPGDPRGIVLQARGKFLSGEQSESMKELRDAAARIGNSPMIAAALLENARAQSDVPVMLEQFAYLRETNPDSIDLAIDEANVRYKSGDRQGARDVGLDILDRFGADQEAMDRLADLWLEHDNAPLSDQDIEAMIAGGSAEARLAAARYLYHQEELARARKLVENMSDVRGAGLLARIDARMGRASGFERARAIADRDTSNCDALAAVSEWTLRSGRIDEAIVPAQVVATECRDRNDGHLLLVRAYMRADRPAGVERVFRDGLDTHPQDRLLSESFARWLLAQGKSRPAISAARRLTKAAPAKVSSWRLLADICGRTGENVCQAEAQAELERARRNYAIDLPPGQRTVNPLLGRSWR